MFPGLVIWNETMHVKKRERVASFPGSNAPEHEHWDYAGVKSLVFFTHVSTVKGREGVERP